MSDVPPAPEKAPAPLTAFLTAVQFLLISPAFIKRLFTARELGAAVGFYPLVGLILGSLLLAADYLLGLFMPPLVRIALILTLWVILTGALHLDGFLDACDGLLGGFTPESRLEIMRDERVGAFALAGGVLLLLGQIQRLERHPAAHRGAAAGACAESLGHGNRAGRFPLCPPARIRKSGQRERHLASGSFSHHLCPADQPGNCLVVGGLADFICAGYRCTGGLGRSQIHAPAYPGSDRGHLRRVERNYRSGCPAGAGQRQLYLGREPHLNTRLLIVRHGRTAWNSNGRFQGQLDIPLDEVGQSQAAAVAHRLSA